MHKAKVMVVKRVADGEYTTPWVEQKGAAIACCTDGYRPVVFKIEWIEE
jgi:uncharacterized repeat protein (TIGR04076 family)